AVRDGLAKVPEPVGINWNAMPTDEHKDVALRSLAALIQGSAKRKVLSPDVADSGPVPIGNLKCAIGRAGVDDHRLDVEAAKLLTGDSGQQIAQIAGLVQGSDDDTDQHLLVDTLAINSPPSGGSPHVQTP